MENKETKNKQTEELNDEALDEVTGGVYQPVGITRSGGIMSPKTVPSKKSSSVGGSVSVPSMPSPGDIRTF